MNLRVTKLGRVAFLSLLLAGSALAQSLGTNPSTAQIQNMEHTAMKIGIASAGVGLGVTVIGLALRHHKHSARTTKSDNDQGSAAEYARLSQAAAAPDTRAAALKVASNQKTPDPGKATGLTADAPLHAQAGSWTGEEAAGTSW